MLRAVANRFRRLLGRRSARRQAVGGSLGPQAVVDGFMATAPSELERMAFLDAAIERVASTNHPTIFWGDRLLTLDKAAGFFADEAFRASFEAIRRYHPYDGYKSPQGIAWR